MIWTATFNPSRNMTFVLDGRLEPDLIYVMQAVYGRSGGKGNNMAPVNAVRLRIYENVFALDGEKLIKAAPSIHAWWPVIEIRQSPTGPLAVRC